MCLELSTKSKPNELNSGVSFCFTTSVGLSLPICHLRIPAELDKESLLDFNRYTQSIKQWEESIPVSSVGVMAGAISREFLGGGKGFGALIRQSASQLDTPRVVAAFGEIALKVNAKT